VNRNVEINVRDLQLLNTGICADMSDIDVLYTVLVMLTSDKFKSTTKSSKNSAITDMWTSISELLVQLLTRIAA
jgi:hypothetical protein